MKITFFETFGDPMADGECTAVREGCAELAVSDDTLMDASGGAVLVHINGCDYKMAGPSENSIWEGVVNPNTRRQRSVSFVTLKRADGAPTTPRIVLLKGSLQRGEAVLDLRRRSESAALSHDSIVCFTRGSRILTAFGDLPVEDLRVGDLVHTVDNGLQPIRWIGSRDVTETRMRVAPHLHPVKICRDTFGPGLPATDIWVSANHRMMLDSETGTHNGVLAPAKGLMNGHNVFVDPQLRDTQYIHLLFEEHQVVFVEGMPSESFFPCPSAIMSLTADDRRSLFEVFPSLENHPLSFGDSARPILQPQEARVLAA